MAAISSASVGFKAGDIDVNSIVNSLMAAERLPASKMSARQADAQLRSDAIGRMKAGFDSLHSAAAKLTAGSLARFTSTVSDNSAVALEIAEKTAAGSVAFTVDRLATAQGYRSSNSVSSATSPVTTASNLAISSSLSNLGIGGLSASSDTPAGTSTVTVTQSSAAASKLGTTTLLASGPVAVTSSNNVLRLSVNGTTYAATIAQGTYTTAASLTTAVQTALTAAGAPATAALDSSGMLKLETVREGSGATLSVASAGNGSTALSVLGLTSDTVNNVGIDGKVRIGSGAASKVGGALGTWPIVTDSSTKYAVAVNGASTVQVSITPGSYADSTALAAAVQKSLTSAGVQGLSVSADSAGALKVMTTLEGSAASFQFTAVSGGDPLKLDSASLAVGTDGTAVSVAESGRTVSVPGTTGTMSFTLAGGLRAGSGSVAVVSTGDKSLGAVVAAINGANAGVSAAAVKQSEGKWMLQLGSKVTGTANRMMLDTSGLTPLGGLLETSSAQNAQITVGSGAGAYSVVAPGNVFTDVLPGVTMTVTKVTTTPVSVAIIRDDSATVGGVQSLIKAANSVLGQIAMQTSYDVGTKTSSPLTGESQVRGLANQVRSLVSSTVSTSTYGAASKIGLTIQKDGSLGLDEAMFKAALAADQGAVERVFASGGEGTGGVSFGASTDSTVAGTYAVAITQAPSRATVVDLMAGVPGTARVIGVRAGSTTVSVNVAAGATNTSIAAALNAQFASSGLNLNASIDADNHLSLTAGTFGEAGNFSYNVDVNGSMGWSQATGRDVVGTINGEAATGVGQRLSVLTTSTTKAAGLAIDVAEGSTVGTKSITYSPGIASRLSAMTTFASGTKGTLGVIGANFDAQVKSLTTQMDAFEVRMTAKEANLKTQWAKVQASLASLKSQQTWLTSQTAAMNATN